MIQMMTMRRALQYLTVQMWPEKPYPAILQLISTMVLGFGFE
jgi:hypothetical protein